MGAESAREAESGGQAPLLLRVIEDLSSARSVEDVAAIIRVAARRLTGADGVTFVLRDAEQCWYLDEDAIGPLWKGQRFPLEACISGWAMLNGKTAIIPDIYLDPRIPHQAYRPTFVKSLVMAPVRAEDPLAAIGAYWATVRNPTDEEVGLLEGLARSTATALANASLIASLQDREARLRLALEAAQLGDWSWDARSDLVSFSERALDIFGLPPGAQMTWRDLRRMLQVDDRNHARAAVKKALADGSHYEIEYRLRRGSDGLEAWVLVRGRPVYQDDGRTGLMGVVLDITDRKRAEQMLRTANARLQAKVETETAERERSEQIRQRFWNISSDLFGVISNVDGKPRELNGPAWELALGYPVETLMQTRLMDLVHPDDHERTFAAKPVLESGATVFGLENRYRHADGGWRHLSWNVVNQGDLSFGIARDVTEDKARDEQLSRAQRLEALGQLTGGVAHDFNNLLTAIMGALDMVQKRPDDAALRDRLLPAALAAARRGERLNKQLLGFARRRALHSEYVGVDAFITDIEPLLRGALGGVAELQLRLDCAAVGCRLDPAQLEGALLNLVVNARDVMPTGGVLTVSTRAVTALEARRYQLPAGAYLMVSVSDTGAGMTPDVRARAFEPFFTTKDVGKGSGLGLSQVYGFVRQSGGAIDIESEPGQGAIVSILLPFAEQDVATPGDGAQPPEHRTASVSVLLVEDDALVGAVTESMLVDLGHTVVRAEDGPRALAILTERKFDLLLTDVRMPGGMNGVDVARQASAADRRMRVLLCSGWTADALGEELQGSDWPLLAKPFDSRRLRVAISEVLNGA